MFGAYTGHADLRDRIFEVTSLGSPPALLSAQVAAHTGLIQLAKQYSTEALNFHKNPVVLQHTYTRLGEFLGLPWVAD